MLLQIKNLSISFPNHHIISNLSFDLSAGKITALIGPSGVGKSLTGLAILKLAGKAKIEGEVVFEENNLLELDEKELCKIRGSKIAMIFQDPNTSLNPLHKIGKQIAEAITIHNPKISSQKLQQRILELLAMVELDSIKTRLNDYPHQFSGGQKQRIMMAIALANNPKILIADEPTTALDAVVQNEVLNLLARLRNELGIAVLLITHNLKAVKKIADNIVVLGDVKPSSLQKNTGSVKKDEGLQVLALKDLAVKHKNHFLLSDINFSLHSGENLGIIGESGSGKSTLALALTNLLSSEFSSSGEISFFGKKSWQKNAFELRRNIQVIFQDPFSSLNPRMLISDIISEGLKIHKISASVDEIMQKLQLSLALKNRYPHQLSGGQRQRVAIARALILNPKILILDEPTSALDFATQNEILKLLLEIQKERDISYILISHDLEVISQISHKIAVLKNGQILELDHKANIVSNPRHCYTKQLISNF